MFFAVFLFSFIVHNSSLIAASSPFWWTSRGVINTNAASTNDYAAVVQGQLKWFATNAYDELDANLSGGAGTNVANTVGSFSQSNNYRLVNMGQLKNVAKPFYDRLIEENRTNSYPWTAATNDDKDYAVANIGQTKYVFSFDPSLTADIFGNISYSGYQTGQIVVVAVTVSNSWATNYCATNSAPGAYSIKALPRQTNYWVRSYRDSSGNASCDYWEATGEYGSNPVFLASSVVNVNLTLSNPSNDEDTDSLPDWWEMHWFSSTNQPPTGDYDSDGLNNSNEYYWAASPTNSDTDADGIIDGTEVANRTDPSNSDTNKPLVTIIFPGDNFRQTRMP